MITNSLTTRWAAAAKVAAIEKSIAAMVSSGAYQVDSEGANKITVVGVNTPTISDYVPGTTTLTYEQLTDNKVDIDIDKYKEFSFTVDEAQVAQSTPDYVPAAITQASEALALEGDKAMLALYSDANIPAGNKEGSIGASISITVSNVLQYASKLSRILRENHVNRGDMWAVVPPWFMDLLAQAAGDRLTANTEVFEFGEVYKYAGLNFVESTEVVAAGAGSDEYQIMAFSSRAIPFVSQIQKVESLMNPSAFGELVRGLYVFGTEIVFPTEVAILSAEEG